MTMNSNEVVLEFRDVSVSFDEKQVLSHIDLKLARGEMLFPGRSVLSFGTFFQIGNKLK